MLVNLSMWLLPGKVWLLWKCSNTQNQQLFYSEFFFKNPQNLRFFDFKRFPKPRTRAITKSKTCPTLDSQPQSQKSQNAVVDLPSCHESCFNNCLSISSSEVQKRPTHHICWQIRHTHQVAIAFPERWPKIYSQESAILSYGQALWSRCDQPGLHCFWVMAKSTMDRMVSAFVLMVALPSCTEGIEAHCLFKCPVTSAGCSARMCRSSYIQYYHKDIHAKVQGTANKATTNVNNLPYPNVWEILLWARLRFSADTNASRAIFVSISNHQ